MVSHTPLVPTGRPGRHRKGGRGLCAQGERSCASRVCVPTCASQGACAHVRVSLGDTMSSSNLSDIIGLYPSQ